MKRMIVVLVLLLAFGMSAVVFAQEGEGDQGAQLINQGEMAQMLVKILGLYRYLPPDPTDAECFELLMVNKISPADGWDAKAPVMREDLARVIILAMGEESSVENPDDPNSWVETLQAMGVDIESVGQAVGQVPPQKDFKSTGFSPTATDPLKRQRFLGKPDERELQSDLNIEVSVPLTFDEVKYVVQGLDPNDYKPTPATPN